MKVSETDFHFMVESLERDVATMLVEEHHMTIHQALDALYDSVTYSKLKDPLTGLYFQSPRYVLSILEQEYASLPLFTFISLSKNEREQPLTRNP